MLPSYRSGNQPQTEHCCAPSSWMPPHSGHCFLLYEWSQPAGVVSCPFAERNSSNNSSSVFCAEAILYRDNVCHPLSCLAPGGDCPDSPKRVSGACQKSVVDRYQGDTEPWGACSDCPMMGRSRSEYPQMGVRDCVRPNRYLSAASGLPVTLAAIALAATVTGTAVVLTAVAAAVRASVGSAISLSVTRAVLSVTRTVLSVARVFRRVTGTVASVLRSVALSVASVLRSVARV